MKLLRSAFLAFLLVFVFPVLVLLRMLKWCGIAIDPWAVAFIRGWTGLILRTLRISVHQAPIESNIPKARVIISNHVGYLDILVLLHLYPTAVFLGKAEIQNWPLIGPLARMMGMVYVERDNLFSRARALLSLQRNLQAGRSVIVFPEGTTSIEGPMRSWGQYYSGAFRLARMEEVSTEWIFLKYSDVERAAWLGDSPLFPHLIGLIRERKGLEVKLRTQSVIPPRDRREQRRQHFRSRQWMLGSGREFLFRESFRKI